MMTDADNADSNAMWLQEKILLCRDPIEMHSVIGPLNNVVSRLILLAVHLIRDDTPALHQYSMGKRSRQNLGLEPAIFTLLSTESFEED
jgi:hypothetical protein